MGGPLSRFGGGGHPLQPPELPKPITLLLALFLAHAHVPHDEVTRIAVPLDLDDDVTWLMLAGSDSFQMLLTSDDGGQRWWMRGGAPLAETLVGVAILEDGTWVAASELQLWWSQDRGETWQVRASPVPVRFLVGGEELLVAGARGAWSGRPGGFFDPLPMASVEAFSDGVEGQAAMDGEGGFWVNDGGGWQNEGAGPGGASAITRIGDDRYAGDTSGSVFYKAGDDWVRCGTLPADALGAHAVVVQMAGSPATDDAPDGVLLVATGDAGPYRSTDACQTWEDLHSPLTPVYTGSGSAASAIDGQTGLAIFGDRWVQSGWAGFLVAEGDDLHEPTIIPPDYTRGIAFSPTFGEDRTLLIGGYAAGVLRTNDAGVSWLGAGEGLGFENVQRVAFPARDGDLDRVLSVTGHVGWLSNDKGQSWAPLDPPMASLHELFGSGSDDLIWAFGGDAGAEEVAVSDDGGKTWSLDEVMNMALAGATPTEIVHLSTPDGSAQVLGGASPTRILYSWDRGMTWVARYSDPLGERLSGPVVWPQEAPTRLVFLDEGGARYSDDGLTWFTWTGFGDDPARVIEAAGTMLFVATESGAIWRSDDGGESFVDLGVRTTSPVHVIRGSPKFDKEKLLLIGTHDGVFTLDDPFSDHPTIGRWAPYQRVDDTSAYLVCSGCGDSVEDKDAGMGAMRELGSSGVAHLSVRGTSLEIFGACDEDSLAELWIDGTFISEIGGRKEPHPARLTRVEGLPWDWHEVELRAVRSGVLLDAIAASGPRPEGDVADVGCASGCATGGPAASVPLLAAVLLALTIRRRG